MLTTVQEAIRGKHFWVKFGYNGGKKVPFLNYGHEIRISEVIVC